MRLLPLTPALLLAASLLAGCSSPAPVRYQGMAASPYLQPNEHRHRGHAPFVYQPAVDWNHYHRFILQPVQVYQGADAQFDRKITPPMRAQLADDLQEQARQQLSRHLAQTLIPSDDTVTIQLTLTGARRTTPFIGTFTKFDVGGTPINLVQAMRGREGLFNGSASYAVEVYTSTDHRLLLAYVDKQYPGAMNIKASLGALTAARTGIHKAAQGLAAQLQ